MAIFHCHVSLPEGTWNSVEIPIPNPIFPSVSGPQVEAYRNIELPSIDEKFQPEKNGISNSYLYLYITWGCIPIIYLDIICRWRVVRVDGSKLSVCADPEVISLFASTLTSLSASTSAMLKNTHQCGSPRNPEPPGAPSLKIWIFHDFPSSRVFPCVEYQPLRHPRLWGRSQCDQLYTCWKGSRTTSPSLLLEPTYLPS